MDAASLVDCDAAGVLSSAADAQATAALGLGWSSSFDHYVYYFPYVKKKSGEISPEGG